MPNSQSNVVAVSEPDHFYGSDYTITCLGNTVYVSSICDILCNLDARVTVYVAGYDSSIDWIISCYSQSDIFLMELDKENFIAGYFIDKPKVFYYNNTVSYSKFNLNEIPDPVDFILKWTENTNNNLRGTNEKTL